MIENRHDVSYFYHNSDGSDFRKNGGDFRITGRGGVAMSRARQAAMQGYITQEGYCGIDRLAMQFGISVATVHRDLTALAAAGRVRKVHGGALGCLSEAAAAADRPDSHFCQRLEKNRPAKMMIAEEAETLIEAGDILFLDSSTTCWCLARRLQSSRLNALSIVTNSVLIAQEFYRFPSHFMLMCLGGNYNCQLNSFLGRMALSQLSQLRLTKAFYSGVGLDRSGLSTYHEDHADFLRQVLDQAAANCLLLDSSKFNRTGLFMICGRERIGRLISEQAPPPELRVGPAV